MNMSEKAKLLNVSRDTVYRWKKEGVLDEKLANLKTTTPIKTAALIESLPTIGTVNLKTGELEEKELPTHNQNVHAVNCPCRCCKPKNYEE